MGALEIWDTGGKPAGEGTVKVKGYVGASNLKRHCGQRCPTIRKIWYREEQCLHVEFKVKSPGVREGEEEEEKRPYSQASKYAQMKTGRCKDANKTMMMLARALRILTN